MWQIRRPKIMGAASVYIYADPHNARACNAPRVVQVDACPSSIRLRGGRGGRRRRLGAAIAAKSTRRSRNMISRRDWTVLFSL